MKNDRKPKAGNGATAILVKTCKGFCTINDVQYCKIS